MYQCPLFYRVALSTSKEIDITLSNVWILAYSLRDEGSNGKFDIYWIDPLSHGDPEKKSKVTVLLLCMAGCSYAGHKYTSGFTGSPFYNVSAGTASWQFLPVTGYHGQTGQGLIPCRSWNTGI